MMSTQRWVQYEWIVEHIQSDETEDHEAGEVLDVDHADTYLEAQGLCSHHSRIALVRDDDDGRSWAYVTNWNIDLFMRDAYGEALHKVPARYLRQFNQR